MSEGCDDRDHEQADKRRDREQVKQRIQGPRGMEEMHMWRGQCENKQSGGRCRAARAVLAVRRRPQ